MNGSVERCLMCRRSRLVSRCEDWERTVKALRELKPGQHYQPKPERAVVCKDCCIGALDGHRCPWWDFCWEEWTSGPAVI